MLGAMGAPPAAVESLCTDAFLASLRRAAWPGNARELRNHLERCLAFEEPLPVGETESAAPSAPVVDASVAYAEARRRAIEAFERAYVRDLLARHDGRITRAAAAAGMDRVYLHKLARRHRP